MKKDFFDMLSKAVIDTQVDGKNILYFSGKFAGYGYKGVGNVKNLEELRNALNSVFKEMKIGSVGKIEKINNNLIIEIRGHFRPENSFMIGFVTGIISKALNYNFYRFTGKEIKCKNRGKSCLFEIKSI